VAQPEGETSVIEGTLVGTVDSAQRAAVDGSGGVRTSRGWTVRWVIGADDRWHDPAEEPSTRQSLVRNAPVVETRVRIPGGDAVGWAYGIQGPSAEGAHEYVMIEIANESPVPVAVGFLVEPDDASAVGSLDLTGGVVSVGGEPALLFASEPRAEPERGYLLPVPHRTSVRVAVPLTAADSYPSVVPSPEQVAAGWEGQVRRGAAVDLPDRTMQDRFEAGIRQLLLRAAGDQAFALTGEADVAASASLAVALDELGFHPEAGLLLAGMAERADRDPSTARALLAALDRHDALAHDEALVRATRRYRKTADKVLRRDPGSGASLPIDPMSALRRLVVDDTGDTDYTDASSGELVLLAGWEAGWAGQPVEAHRLPTRHGVVSFGLRWHGERPALLWEVLPFEDVPPPFLRLPALDRGWVGEAAAGEALLRPFAPSEAVER
jgi:hypothetical protein